MSKTLVTLFLLAGLEHCSIAEALSQEQAESPHSASVVADTARYEIVGSPIANKWTFRLDRVCGNLAQTRTLLQIRLRKGLRQQALVVAAESGSIPE